MTTPTQSSQGTDEAGYVPPSDVRRVTPYENAILTHLFEECSEVIQRIAKMQRFGINECQPGQPYNNCDRLSHEIGNLQKVIDLAIEEGLISPLTASEGYDAKERKLKRYPLPERQ